MKSYVFPILVLGQLLTMPLNVGGVIPNVIMAENSDEQPKEVINRLVPITPSKRPRMPFANPINYTVEDGMVSVDFPAHLESITFEIYYDDMLVCHSVLTDSTPIIILVFKFGEYRIHAIDNNNIEYEGTFVL